jgi:hypothetical protein
LLEVAAPVAGRVNCTSVDAVLAYVESAFNCCMMEEWTHRVTAVKLDLTEILVLVVLRYEKGGFKGAEYVGPAN